MTHVIDVPLTIGYNSFISLMMGALDAQGIHLAEGLRNHTFVLRLPTIRESKLMGIILDNLLCLDGLAKQEGYKIDWVIC